MKSIRNLLIGMALGVGLIVGLHLLHAQEMAMPVQGGLFNGTINDTEDVSSMSDEQVLLRAVEMLPTVSADSVPRSGTFYSAQHAPGTRLAWPPLPINARQVPVWDLGDGIYLMADQQVDYSLPFMSLNMTSGRMGMMGMNDSSGPMPGGGGGGGGDDTNSFYSSSFNFAPDYGTNLWIAQVGISSGYLMGILSNSVADIPYEIQSKTDLLQADWFSEGFISGSELTNWTPLSVPQNGRTNLFLRVRSWQDDGSGLPLWWQQQYFGTNGVDPYGDPTGDGWNNLQKFQNGMNPNVFYTPPTPTGFSAMLATNQTDILLSWNPSPGPVQHYTIGEYVYSSDNWNWTYQQVAQVNPGTTTFEDAGAFDPGNYDDYNNYFDIEADYSGGSSPQVTSWINLGPTSPSTTAYNLNVTAQLVRNSIGHWQLMFSGIPSNVQKIAFYWYMWDYFYDYGPYPSVSPFTTEYDIPVSSITNGIYILPDILTTNWFPNNAFGKVAMVQPIGTNNEYGNLCQAGFQPYDSPVFVDGRQHVKQNLLFELRAATISRQPISLSENYIFSDPYWISVVIPTDTNYVESSIFHYSLMSKGYNADETEYLKMDDVWPVTANYEFHGSLYDPGFNGASFDWQPQSGLYNYDFSFQGTLVIPSPVLGVGDPYWISQDLGNLADVAAYANNGNLYLESGVNNLFGLAFKQALVNNGNPLVTLNTGSSVGMANVNCFYSQTADPSLQLVNYYFAPVNTPGTAAPNENPLIEPYPLPALPGFASTNQTGMMITSVGTPTVIGGWAKFSIQNGSSSKFAYLGQYFVTNAFVVNANGVVSANTTGILSPYGEFFPTEPGTVAMMTMPDIDTGAQGTGVVRVISLNVDADHDGTMDFKYNSPDFVSSSKPFRFWVNDNVDAGDYGGNGGIPGVIGSQADGYNYWSYTDNGPFYRVHGTRDLVDFFPVYINIGSLFQSNALSAGISATDTNYQFVLSQADGVLRFAYTDLTPTNYMNFLRDTNEAQKLGGYSYPDPEGAPLTTIPNLANGGTPLPASFIASMATNNEGIILVEAATNTTQPLVLTIYHGTNQIAQTSLYLSISGVEQMFRHKNLLLNSDPSAAADRLTDADVPNEPDTIDKNLVFVHGYNVNSNQARGVAADMFKRMYWSGSHAKFYAVTWEGADSQWFDAVTVNYQTNVFNAFNTAPVFATFVGSLTNGPTVVAAHSLGNMVVLDALNDYSAPVSQYFMLDAAVPMEAIDPTTGTNIYMIASAWQAYSNRLYAANWHSLWTNLDYRSTLTWSNRLANFNGAQVYNFYSSGEEVLRQWNLDAPTNLLTFTAQALANYEISESPFASYVWVWQEKGKGLSANDGVLSSTHGGWRFNTNYTALTVAQANALPASQIQTNAFFDFASSNFTADLGLYGSLGNLYAYYNHNRIIADAIPALSLPVGANPVPIFSPPQSPSQRNVDMMTFENNWPQGRLNSREGNNWHHSDFHQVAYTFTYQLFNQIVTTGNLK